MSSKPVLSAAEAVADIADGASIMVGGFAAAGIPYALIHALRDRGVRGLTLITNSGGSDRRPDHVVLLESRMVRRLVCSYATPATRPIPLDAMHEAGEVEVEMMPQGTFAERIRAAGAGIGGVMLRTGIGTAYAEGRQLHDVDGVPHLLEAPLHADVAFVRAHRADVHGNLVYRYAARNFNPEMATAADLVIAEVDELVASGSIDPEAVVTPATYVDRLVIGGREFERHLGIVE
jgi:3-oxoadipate CoA-transferase alpha subunit